SVNLGNNAYAFDEIRHNNYLGTIGLLHGLHAHLSKVSYVSKSYTFYSDSYGNYSKENFEVYKKQTEQDIELLCSDYTVGCKVCRTHLRPQPHHISHRHTNRYPDVVRLFYRISKQV